MMTRLEHIIPILDIINENQDIGNNKFIHASTTKGVMMSDLGNPYWMKYYVMSRRIIKN